MLTAKITKEDALKGITPQALARMGEQARQAMTHIEREHAALAAQFPHQWVAAINSEIVGPASTPDGLRDLLEERGFDPVAAVFAYLEPEQGGLIV